MLMGLFCLVYPLLLYLFANVNHYLPTEEYVYLLPEIIHSLLILGHICLFWLFFNQFNKNRQIKLGRFDTPKSIKWGVLAPLFLGFVLVISGVLLPGPVKTRAQAKYIGRSIASHWYGAEGRDIKFTKITRRDEYWILEGVSDCPVIAVCKYKKLILEIDEDTGWLSFYDFKYVR